MSGKAAYWDDLAQRRWGRYISEVEQRFILDEAASAAPGHMVEVGCGGGRWCALLADRGWSVTGVDVDPEALALARERVPGGEFVRTGPADSAIPLEDGAATMVLCVEVVAAVGASWFLPEVRRVLAPGGLLVTTVWNRESLRGGAGNLLSLLRDGRAHPFYTASYRSWRRRLTAHGFTETRADGLCWAPFGRASDSRLVPVAAGLERVLRLRRLPSVSPWVLVAARRDHLVPGAARQGAQPEGGAPSRSSARRRSRLRRARTPSV